LNNPERILSGEEMKGLLGGRKQEDPLCNCDIYMNDGDIIGFAFYGCSGVGNCSEASTALNKYYRNAGITEFTHIACYSY
jgi:hypothetical protein